jgi:hypothetical protein
MRTETEISVFNEIKRNFPSRKLIFMKEIIEKIYGNEIDHRTKILIGDAMQKSGWEKQKFGRQQYKYYYLPGIDVNESNAEIANFAARP